MSLYMLKYIYSELHNSHNIILFICLCTPQFLICNETIVVEVQTLHCIALICPKHYGALNKRAVYKIV